MELHLIRHAHAEDTVPDEARRLSPRGRRQALAQVVVERSVALRLDLLDDVLARISGLAAADADRSIIGSSSSALSIKSIVDSGAPLQRELAVYDQSVGLVKQHLAQAESERSSLLAVIKSSRDSVASAQRLLDRLAGFQFAAWKLPVTGIHLALGARGQ